jgi:hypothetical protein
LSLLSGNWRIVKEAGDGEIWGRGASLLRCFAALCEITQSGAVLVISHEGTKMGSELISIVSPELPVS